MYNHQLDTFIRTAELGSFGKASEALFISSTAVIQQINLLENLCGFRLFVRSNHGVKLTPAGRSLCEMNACVLITQPVYQDIHPNLVTIPLKTDFSVPYGLIYAREPTEATVRFIRAVSGFLTA